jgi:hypothetical protein
MGKADCIAKFRAAKHAIGKLAADQRGGTLFERIDPLISPRIDATLAGNKVSRAVVMRFVAVRTFEAADVRIENERVGALAGHALPSLDRKSLNTGFANDQPDQGHFSLNLTDRICQLAAATAVLRRGRGLLL